MKVRGRAEAVGLWVNVIGGTCRDHQQVVMSPDTADRGAYTLPARSLRGDVLQRQGSRGIEADMEKWKE